MKVSGLFAGRLMRLNLRLGEYVCRRIWEHDHEYVDDPPTLTELWAFHRSRGPVVRVGEITPCPTCGAPLDVEPDGTDLYVKCQNEHEVSSTRDRSLWEQAVATNGYARVCVNWWEQHA